MRACIAHALLVSFGIVVYSHPSIIIVNNESNAASESRENSQSAGSCSHACRKTRRVLVLHAVCAHVRRRGASREVRLWQLPSGLRRRRCFSAQSSRKSPDTNGREVVSARRGGLASATLFFVIAKLFGGARGASRRLIEWGLCVHTGSNTPLFSGFN